ncbi:serine dehydratase subunit alpha family protein [Shewanella dokdonensis]|uniref:L-cysteine desulfidase family protein n=2 Tax=Shewanella dokdonensis TaxID=712036 RepID=UPI00200EBE2B|nr:L-serine ammonia-lyase, iron-sulfur-dependent, subunit alpha [Shewanella dokdonensis]MCL1074497.1 L-serine ammonia-lyase, iron-sulfur-dependent, subunit alpha [Shewanella dokdonensis]
MRTDLWELFINTVKAEVIPALGCTEPVAVGLAAAIARSKLQALPESIQVEVSPNLMKNGMGVKVPGTGMTGLAIAAAVGAIGGDATAGLEVFHSLNDAKVTTAKQLLETGKVKVTVADTQRVLLAKVAVFAQQRWVQVTIADEHTNVVAVEENGVTTFMQQPAVAGNPIAKLPSHTTVQDIYQFITEVPVARLAFIEQAKQLNEALSQEGLSADYGLQVGATLQRHVARGLISGGLLTDVISRSAAASDARMGGAMLPAMSNSGSGNQGIAATMPVVVAAEYLKSSHEQLLRALMLSHLLAIYIKHQQHKLSALCTVTTAAMGSAAGITYLLGGDYQQISYAVSSMIGDVAGVICDGAKNACAMKVSSSAGAAVKSSLMAIDNIHVTGQEGIVADDVDSSIRNLSALANGAMSHTDQQILDIMVQKAL